MKHLARSRAATAAVAPATRPLRTAALAQVRGGALDSGPSDANRIIERHQLPGNQG